MNQISIRPYTHKELAALYEVSWPTFQRYLKPIAHLLGKKNGHRWMSYQVKIIIKHLGPPSAFMEIE